MVNKNEFRYLVPSQPITAIFFSAVSSPRYRCGGFKVSLLSIIRNVIIWVILMVPDKAKIFFSSKITLNYTQIIPILIKVSFKW